MTCDVWVEVHISALKHNLRQVRGILAPEVKIAAVVKGNGFGHGFVEPSRAFVEAGADMLAATRLDEAMILRDGGISAPILLFAPIQPENAEAAIEADLQMTVSDIGLMRCISETASKMDRTARVHIKADTGMGRLGATPAEAIALVESAGALPNIEIAGVYTHFATAAEPDISKCQAQLRQFHGIIEQLKASGVKYGLAHAANSAGILRLPESHFDMVRPGTILYGQYPSASVPRTLDLKPTWKLKARVCEVKTLPKGASVGYGCEFITKRPTRTAVVPIGWADGFTLAPEGPIYRQGLLKFAARRARRRLSMEIRGAKAPVIGRVAMQMCVLDVTDIAGVEVGDEVIVPAMRIPTSALVPRVYDNG